MVKPLTTNPNVWKIMAVIATLLTVCTVLFFLFYLITIPIVIGAAMIVITERLLHVYRQHTEVAQSPVEYATRTASVIFFWTAIVFFFYQYTVGQYDSIVTDYLQNHSEVAAWVRENVRNFLNSDGQTAVLGSIIPFHGMKEAIHVFNETLFHCLLIVPLLFVFHFTNKLPQIKRDFLQAVPIEYKKTMRRAIRKIRQNLSHHFSSRIRAANAYILFSALAYYIIGMKGALCVALLVGALTFIPHIGIIIATLIAMVIAGTQTSLHPGGDFLLGIPIDNLSRMCLVFIVNLCIVLIDVLYLKKNFYRGQLHVDPLLEIVLILAASQLLGIKGMFFAVPIYLIYKVVLTEFYSALTTRHLDQASS